METSEEQCGLREIVREGVQGFLIFCPRGEASASRLEAFVVNNIRRKFGFTRETAVNFFKPIFWKLCCAGPGNWDVAYEQKFYVGSVENSLRFVGDLKEDYVGEILEKYGDYLIERLRIAEYRGAQID